MHVLVSGAAGFIGAHLVSRLAGADRVTALYRNMHPDVPGVDWRQVEFPGDVDAALGGLEPDAIVHLAQSRRYRDFPEAAREIFDVNVGGTMAMIDFALRAGVRRFLMASTGSVYSPAATPRAESDLPAPGSFHAAAKLAGETLLAAAGGQMNVCVLRLFFPYGPGQTGRLVSDLIARVREGRPVTLQGQGGGLAFNPTYVEDVVDVFEEALRGDWTGTLNVAAPHTIDIRTTAELIGAALGKAPVYEHVPGREPVPLLPALERLAERYPLDAFTNPEVGLARTVEQGRAG